MTVGELINQLALYAHESDNVFIWVDGNRYEIANIDDMGESIIDITAKVDLGVTE
jgi:hypothetical protein